MWAILSTQILVKAPKYNDEQITESYYTKFYCTIISTINLICSTMQVDKTQYEKILSYIERGKKEGATLFYGGKPLDRKGYYDRTLI